jgi:HAE1 family hydrophobic/amphiphilic exporter-1
MVVYQEPGSNAVAVADRVTAQMKAAAESFPDGVSYTTIVDGTQSIRAGIEEIALTLLASLLLVVVIIFLFIQDWRATIIPVVAIPVSIIGTFIAFPLFGLSINVVSLLALVLAIGLVVDDAIVVVEAVQVGIEGGMKPFEATVSAMSKVSGAVIATSVVLLAVFVPVALVEGIVGKVFQQFAIGISVALVISAFNALTLSPALCSLLLRRGHRRATRGPLGLFNRLFDRGVDGYMRRSAVVVRHSVRTVLLVAIMGVATALLFGRVPGGFLTVEDQGYLMVSVNLPDAASVERTERAIEKASEIIRAEQGVRYEASAAGFDLISGVAATNTGIIFVTLEPFGKRKLSAEEIAQSLNAKLLTAVPEGTFYAFEPPSIPGLGVTSGVTFMLQNRGSGDVRYLAHEAEQFMAKMRGLKEIGSVSTQFDADVPQRHIVINEPLALQQGVDVESLRELITTMYGGEYVGNFNRFGRLYQTYIQADAEYRRTESDLGGFYIANSEGEQVPVVDFVELRDTVGVEYINQFNLYDAIAINATPSAGTSTGSAMRALEELADEALPEDVTLAWSGVSYQEANASSGGATYLLAIIFVFLALAALYNSWALPMSVLLGVPLALFGSLLLVWLAHFVDPIYVDNIFMKVSLVMLIGLSAKSAILVVEYADRKFFEEGLELGEAALAAAKLRLRPILMTAIAFIVGMLPLVFASGAYAVARNIMGLSLVGGMLVATVLGIFVYPSLYYMVGRVARFEKRRERKQKQRIEYEKESTL